MASTSTLNDGTHDAWHAPWAKHAKNASLVAAYGVWVTLGLVGGMFFGSVIGEIAFW
jgi:hypothetical protein